ncbi:MAG: hypothetical protein KAW12_27995 [Candidatus Aminicenantes bacterium]|nr:hypothetical protein [Candidatus Aminicenantes bacterium]
MNNEVYKDYLLDLIVILKEYASEAKSNKVKSIATKDEDYNTGYLMGYHRVISLMQQQAEGFQIPLEELGLDKIDPDRDLI